MSSTLAPAPVRRHATVALPYRSRVLSTLFTWYVWYYLSRHFHAVRVAWNGVIPTKTTGPLLVVLNHPSWWDPLLCQLLLSYFPNRLHYGPIESTALARYSLFEYMGYFGIDSHSYEGAARFLRTGQAVLAEPRGVLWVTAQGHFTDVRVRPPGLRTGVGHLVHRVGRLTVLPVALEYPFWEERTPEALIRFGTPLVIEDGSLCSARKWTARIEQALADTQDRLAESSLRRDRTGFETVLHGKVGVGGMYDLGRRIWFVLRGRQFRSEHGVEPPPETPPVC